MIKGDADVQNGRLGCLHVECGQLKVVYAFKVELRVAQTFKVGDLRPSTCFSTRPSQLRAFIEYY